MTKIVEIYKIYLNNCQIKPFASKGIYISAYLDIIKKLS